MKFCCELFKMTFEKNYIEYDRGYWVYFHKTNPEMPEEYTMPDVSPILFCPFCGAELKNPNDM